MVNSLEEGNKDAGFGFLTARERTNLTPDQLIQIGKRMLVNNMEHTYNLARRSGDADHLTRILQCPHCPRSIAEYGAESLPSKHPKGIFVGIVELAREQGVEIVFAPCNHHGGELYQPEKDLQISV